MDAIGWDKIAALPAALIVLLAILGFFLRAMPYWKEIKLAEISVREKEADSRVKQAEGFGQLSTALVALSKVTHDVSIEQRRATDNMKLMQRVTAQEAEKLQSSVDSLAEQIASLDKRTDKEKAY